jgi:hypothetical protein
MGITTWLDRITDESNSWLSASRAEAAKDYSAAAVLYLDDASACVKRESKVRAALSCFCAAECMDALGARMESKRLYYEAGRLYASMADHGLSGSIREALWALQRAHACYTLAEQVKEAEAINGAYKLLARRANPFEGGSQWLEMPKVAPRQYATLPSRNLKPPAEVMEAMAGFLILCGGKAPQEEGLAKFSRAGDLNDDQESFVSQLG